MMCAVMLEEIPLSPSVCSPPSAHQNIGHAMNLVLSPACPTPRFCPKMSTILTATWAVPSFRSLSTRPSVTPPPFDGTYNTVTVAHSFSLHSFLYFHSSCRLRSAVMLALALVMGSFNSTEVSSHFSSGDPRAMTTTAAIVLPEVLTSASSIARENGWETQAWPTMVALQTGPAIVDIAQTSKALDQLFPL